MNKRTAMFSAAAVVTLSGLLAGLAGTGAFAATKPVAKHAAKHAAIPNGGTLVQTVPSSFGVNFIPLLDSSAYNQNVTGLMFDPILTINANNQLIGDIVQKWWFSKNLKTTYFKINPNAKWSNGIHVTSKDVELGVDWLASQSYNNKDNGAYNYIVSSIVGAQKPLPDGTTPSGFKIISPTEFSITQTTVDPTNLGSNLQFITPLPTFILGKIPMSKWSTSAFNKQPTIGDGPFTITQIVPNQSVTMKANPYYVFGKPHIAFNIWKVVSPDVVSGDLVSGQVSIAAVHATDFNKLKNAPGLATNVTPQNSYDFLGWRLNNAVYGKEFSNVKFRQAVEYALNRPALVQALDKGYATVVNGPFPSANSYADKALANSYKYNPTLANKLLNEAGFKIGKNGWRTTPGGRPFTPTLTYASGDSLLQTQAEFMKQFMNAVHINLKLNAPISFEQQLNELNNDTNGKQPIQGFLEAWNLGSGPQDPRGLWLSNATFNTTTQDWTQPVSVLKQNDKLLAEQASAAAYNPAYRQRVLNQWQQLWNTQLPTNNTISDDLLTVYSNKLHGVVFSPYGTLFIYKWYLTK
ncbi:ABC transporter substrate-binding protein [Ferroacidibacillus organovorans]|uniref:Solute-binding protein family 5 domain-containing protein n=1 Tax=Ferroacidibacillus organovorans TaxID=1765683 RepID=A0A853KEQ1_9BACL|nr:ABC transporter substrate-binding protein [Ferroacidibacillus organovorans]KYP80904.1 hypothetical protein AYJ22_01760 [Ferroacidibacillus organovorans]OAG95377.1 hypothetical protein AYW79_00225 [Ferroacidibacillus organovorans]